MSTDDQSPVAKGTAESSTRRRKVIATLVLIPIGVVLVFSLWLASEAGELPWQTDPTRIPITPFANLPTVEPAAATPSPRE
ncbi:hypothetical protein BH23CHL5_BH23CHL5_24300 [soil metagenome]